MTEQLLCFVRCTYFSWIKSVKVQKAVADVPVPTIFKAEIYSNAVHDCRACEMLED